MKKLTLFTLIIILCGSLVYAEITYNSFNVEFGSPFILEEEIGPDTTIMDEAMISGSNLKVRVDSFSRDTTVVPYNTNRVKLIFINMNTNEEKLFNFDSDEEITVFDYDISIKNIRGGASIGSVDVIVSKKISNICTDSDNGKNYYVKGFVNDNGEISWDICSTPSIEGYEGAADYIFEKFCDDDGHVHGEQSKCPNGCQDGACLKESGTKCTDSDGGKDYSVKGSVSFGGTEHEDSCMFNQDKFLVEAYCENNFQKLETVECKDRCENGKCVSGNIASGNCKDSEDGIDIYNKGYVLSSGSKLYDYCDDNSIVDYICMGNTPREDRTVCPYGCNDGVCITSKNPSQSCSDSDEGQNYFTKGKVIWAGNEIYDYCSTRSGNTVYEQYCYNNELKYERYECPNKCSDGRCIDKTEDEYKGFLSLAVNSKEIELVANQRQNKIVLKYYGGDSNNPSVCGLEVNGENVEFMEEQTKTVEGVRISLIDIVPGSKSSYPRCEVNIKAMACIDSDGSKNYFEKGFVDFEGEIVYDYCNDGSENQLIESYCTDNDKVDTISYDCPDRCENGVCIHETEEVTLPKGFVDNVGDNCNNNEDCSSHNCVNNICRPYCEGCMMDESCIPYGTRHESNYCDITKIINSQKGEYESCSNNYECTTNLCVDNQCVSSNLIQKIIQWFKKLFGG